MKKIYILCILLIVNFHSFSQFDVEWQRMMGGSGEDRFYDVQLTNDNGYIAVGLSGSSDGYLSGNLGNYDVWVVKLNKDGILEWEQNYGGSNFDYGFAIRQTSDGGFVIGGHSNSNDGDISGNHGGWDFLLIKIDSIGNIQWQKSYGGSDADRAYCVQQTNDNGYILAGETRSNDGDVSGHHFDWDYWIVKVDSVGNIQWQKCLGGTGIGTEGARNIEQTADGGYIVAGEAISNNGDVSGNHGLGDYWVVKLDNIGNIQWQKCYGGSNRDLCYSINKNNEGGYIIGGWSLSTDGDKTVSIGGWDYWIIKIDSVGNVIWEKTYGGAASDVLYSIKSTSDSGYIAVGYTWSVDGDINTPIGAADSWVLKLDKDGMIEWEKSYGGTDWESAHAIQQINGGFIVAGSSQSNNGDVSGNSGWVDCWILKLSNDFNSVTGKTFGDINSNSVKDSNEYDIPNILLTEINSGRIAFSNSQGEFILNLTDTGNFVINAASIPYFVASPQNYSGYFSNMNETDSLNDFAYQPAGTVNDLRIDITPISAFRPGFNAHYNINYKNSGNTILNGNIILYPDTNINFISSTVSPDSITAGSIVWNLNNIDPFDDSNFQVTVYVNSTAVIGDSISSLAVITPVIGDTTPGDNQSSWLIGVTGSWDPNDILVNKDFIHHLNLSDCELEYIIRFQNTGNDTAFTVKIINNIEENLDLVSFEFISSSHPVDINFFNHSRLFEFKFNNIQLPDSNTNELLSHGFIRYRIKPKSTLVVGDLIENFAAIYFDFNYPVITNTAITKIVAFVPTITPSNLILCPNESDTLWTQVYDSYQWYKDGNLIPGANQQFLVVDYFNDAGYYFYVEVDSAGFFETSDSALVDGYAFLPPFVIQSGNFTIGSMGEMIICPGDTAYLILGQPYDTLIQWTDNGNIISGANNDTLIVTQVGLYHVTGAPSQCPNYVQGLFDNIQVIMGTSPAPTVTPNNLILCPNESDTLWTQVFGSYQWYKDGVAIPGATQQYLVVEQFNDAGYMFSVEVTQNGCTGTSTSVLVDGYAFLPLFVIQDGTFTIGSMGEMIMCPGDTAYLILGQPYDTNIQWTDNGVAIPGANNDTLIVTQSGLYHVTGAPSQCPNFVQGLFDDITVLVQGPPMPVITLSGNNLTTQAGFTYQWYYNGNPIGTNSNTIPSQGAGTYTVTITDANGCTAESNPFVVTSVIENSISGVVNINYNPATGNLHISRSNSTNELEFTILDVTGRIIADVKMTKGIVETEINLQNVKPGIYFVKTADGGSSVKFLVE